MKKLIIISLFLIGIIYTTNAQNKITYVEVYKMQTGWTAVISGNIITDNRQMNSDIMPKMSERLYVLPNSGKLFDTHIYALNFLGKLGFKIVEAYQMNGNTCFLMETNKIITITVTNDWTTKKKITINK
jgi:hypothetical protein